MSTIQFARDCIEELFVCIEAYLSRYTLSHPSLCYTEVFHSDGIAPLRVASFLYGIRWGKRLHVFPFPTLNLK